MTTAHVKESPKKQTRDIGQRTEPCPRPASHEKVLTAENRSDALLEKEPGARKMGIIGRLIG